MKKVNIILVICGIFLIMGLVGHYLYWYAPLGKIKFLNRTVIKECNQLLGNKKQVLCLFDENTKDLIELPIEVNELGYALDAPLSSDNNFKPIEIEAQILPTSYPDMQEIKLYQQHLLNKVMPNNVLILSINLPQIFKASLYNVSSEQHEIINKPAEPVSLCFAVEPYDTHNDKIAGEYLVLPSNLIFSKEVEGNNIFCTKLKKLEEFPILTYVNKLPAPTQERTDYFGVKIWLPSSALLNKTFNPTEFENNLASFIPFYRYRLPFFTTIIKTLKY